VIGYQVGISGHDGGEALDGGRLTVPDWVPMANVGQDKERLPCLFVALNMALRVAAKKFIPAVQGPFNSPKGENVAQLHARVRELVDCGWFHSFVHTGRLIPA
jgi:hypothetical protein